jgi:putative transposase
LGIARRTLYTAPTVRTARDQLAIHALLQVHEEHPYYGVRRLAAELGWSEAKTRRVRSLANITAAQVSRKRRGGKRVAPEIPAPPNVLKRYAVFKDAARPQDGMDYSGMAESDGWAQDFTHLNLRGIEHYLAVVVDIRTRRVFGWKLGLRHSSELTYTALLDALSRHGVPAILHSDQGSEYLSYRHRELCERLEIQFSASSKGSPWQNTYVERFFGTLKREFPYSHLKSTEELHVALALWIHGYNTKRRHTGLGNMSPAAYAASLKQAASPLVKERDKVRGKSGA